MRIVTVVRSCFLGLLFLLPEHSSTCLAQSKRPISFEDLREFTLVEDLDISPDGQWLAYTITNSKDVWVVSTHQGSTAVKIGIGKYAVWSPDSNKLTYYSNKTGKLQLYVFDIKSHRTEKVTNFKDGVKPDPMTGYVGMNGALRDPYRLSWSPQSEKLVFPSQVVTMPVSPKGSNAKEVGVRSVQGPPDPRAPLVLTDTSPPEWTLAGVFKIGGIADPRIENGEETQRPEIEPLATTSDQLFIVDVRSKVATQLTGDDAGYFTPDWSPDGKTVLCVSNEGRPLRGWGSGPTNVYTIDVGTGRKRAVTNNDAFKNIPKWSPDGTLIAYQSAPSSASSFIELAIVTPNGNRIGDATAKLDRYVEDYYWAADSKAVIVGFWDGVDWPIARIRIGAGEVERLTGSESAARFPIVAAKSGTVAWSESGPRASVIT